MYVCVCVHPFMCVLSFSHLNFEQETLKCNRRNNNNIDNNKGNQHQHHPPAGPSSFNSHFSSMHPFWHRTQCCWHSQATQKLSQSWNKNNLHPIPLRSATMGCGKKKSIGSSSQPEYQLYSQNTRATRCLSPFPILSLSLSLSFSLSLFLLFSRSQFLCDSKSPIHLSNRCLLVYKSKS